MLERRHSLFLPLLFSPEASGHFAVVLLSPTLRSVHPSCSPFIRQRFSRSVHLSSGSGSSGPLDAFILRSLVQFLLCSVHLSLVAVFFPIIQVWPFDGHYRVRQLKLHKPTMAIGYSLRMCARHVDSTNPGRSTIVFRSKSIPEAGMSNRLIDKAKYMTKDKGLH